MTHAHGRPLYDTLPVSAGGKDPVHARYLPFGAKPLPNPLPRPPQIHIPNLDGDEDATLATAESEMIPF